MSGPLPTGLRNDLGRVITRARQVAEAGARKALESLAVERHEPHGSMSVEERMLRNRLRARGRQLGDVRDKKRGTQSIDRLAHEVAYEHWHRMLFARFLAENDLLIHPDHGIAVSLDEIEELAREAGEDPRTMAARFAQDSLPQIFRTGDPVLEVSLAPETRQALDKMLDSLPAPIFTADDSLGWTYQYWQSEKKDEVNASGNKIGADELPAVTQLFTEHYMVLFLYHNTIGAWHAGKVLAEKPSLAETARSEEDLRRAVRLGSQGGYDWEYLRFVKVDAASRRVEVPDGDTPFSGVPELSKSRDGSSTVGYFDKIEPIANLSGNLPHWRQEGVTYFVTFRTADSLPKEKLEQWLKERESWLVEHPEPHDEATRRLYYKRFPDRLQKWLDAGQGACILDLPEVHEIVEGALRHFDGVRYHLDEFIVMPNHVHALVTPIGEHTLSEILHSWKSFTSHTILKVEAASRRLQESCLKHGSKRHRIWQKESFDHIVRSPEQMARIRQYIRENPKVDAASRRVDLEDASKVDAASRRVDLEAAPGRLETRRDAASTFWRPAAGSFEGWPKSAKELKVLDPCCGSGHFLVEGFELLVRLRMDEEGLDLEEAIRAVLADNLHGLEIDPRCTQIAAFNLAMVAWKMAGRPIELPPLHIACSGLAVGSTKKEWTKLAGDDTRLRAGMERLYDLFEKAPELGSLIDPKSLKGDMFEADFAELQPLLEQALARESDDVEDVERAVAAQGMVRAAELLSGEYTLAITNVPYLGRGQQSEVLKDHADVHYKESKSDLATIFVDRMLRWLSGTCTAAAVTPQNWLFMASYKKLREKFLTQRTWNLVARLGPGGFETISGEVVNVALPVITGSKPIEYATIAGIDVSVASTPTNKANLLRGEPFSGMDEARADGALSVVAQAEQSENPDARISLRSGSGGRLLLEICRSFLGLGTGDLGKYVRNFWEFSTPVSKWSYYQRPIGRTCPWGGADSVVAWDSSIDRVRDMSAQEREQIHNQDQSGQQAWGRAGISISLMGTLRASLFTGAKYDKGTTTLIPKDINFLPALWCFCRHPNFNTNVREVDPNVMCSSGAVVKVPFDLAHWQKVAAEKYPNGLPDPQSDDPTQWLFHGHPAKAEPAAVLQVAVGRLLGYCWPPERDPEMRLADEAREWVARCDALKQFADEDGIVCLSATRGERSAADRLRELLSAAFKVDAASRRVEDLVESERRTESSDTRRDAASTLWSAAKERELLAVAGDGKKPAASLEIWLREKFFEEHCRRFHHRPFVWHIWDGNKDGFHCLVNAHKLTGPNGEGRRTLEAITYSYLGDWIERQRADQRDGKEGADARLASALDLQGQLEKILAGELPYDLFVRWKPLHEQAIGWEPDINDGVRLNIRPFMKAELRKGGKKGAGILRWKPNIKWSKDRGKEPESLRPKADFPWFWGCKGDGAADDRTDFFGGSEFDGNRWNDLHYTLSARETARMAREEES